jgi:NAD(P)-dependent dehydrogenase (short-subunit alcohol dehydrogenase family)
MKSELKVAVVTGASGGIGVSLVAAYRAQGYAVIATSQSVKPSFAAGDEAIVTVAGDLTDPATADQVISTALERFGRIDTLVNNAGIFISKPFVAYTPADFASMVAVNLRTFFQLTQLAAAQMLKQNSGHIVTITTTLVEQPLKEVPALLASLTKGGLDAATRSLAIEYADRGVRVNAVAPGIVKTPLHKPETFAALAGLHPMGRMGEISDVVGAVMYLETAGFVTGEILHVDGGQHAGHW